ncbi:MAG: murein L,D-transpeptidase catalytic domain family protein [Dehalococcoidia bacterium]
MIGRAAAIAAAVLLAAPVAALAAADASEIVERLDQLPDSPGRVVLDAALSAHQAAVRDGRVTRPELLTVIDYSRPSTERRLWVFDLKQMRVLFHELVAHGQKSGENLTRAFSNAPGSHMTSLGLFVTDQAYVGRNGYSLRLDGLDRGLNDNARLRAVVVHGAAYVSERIAALRGRLGRSHGCPAVRPEVARALIDAIKGGSAIFAYALPAAARVTASR